MVDDLTNMVDEVARKTKMKKVTKNIPPLSKRMTKREISQCMESFKEVTKYLIESRKLATPAAELHESMKVLNNTTELRWLAHSR